VLIARRRSFYGNNRSCGAAKTMKFYHSALQHGICAELGRVLTSGILMIVEGGEEGRAWPGGSLSASKVKLLP
jgi:hypothetical protein